MSASCSVCFMCNGLGCTASSDSTPSSVSPLKALASKIEARLDEIEATLRMELDQSMNITHRDYNSVRVYLQGLNQLTDELFDHIE